MSELTTKRWYFLTVGTAMGKAIFDALAGDQEFLAVPRKGADPRNKQLVRLYHPCGNSAPDGVFHGGEFPNLDANKPVKPVEGLPQALQSVLGIQSATARDTPVIMMLADNKFDDMLRAYQLALNKQYMQLGALPFVSLIYTDDAVSAENLMNLMEQRDTASRYEQAYQRTRQTASAPDASMVPPPFGVDGQAVARSVVEQYRPRIIDKYIFFAPNIPPKKLENVYSSYAKEARGEQALVLIDNTTFGNAKDGGLITDRRFYVHNSLSAPARMDLCDIQTVEFVQKFPSYPLMINGSEFLQTAYPEKPSMHKLAGMLVELAAKLHPVPAPVQPVLVVEGRSPVAMIKELKDLLDLGAITQQEFDEKRQKYLEKL